jgi:hypothetical protein
MRKDSPRCRREPDEHHEDDDEFPGRVTCEFTRDTRRCDERLSVDDESAPVPPPAEHPAVPKAGGKAKASKGKGRAPAVKGQQRVGKRRQSR